MIFLSVSVLENMIIQVSIRYFISQVNRPNSQIPKCINPISHNAPLCNRNVHTCAHFCYKMVHCGIFVRCSMGFEILDYSVHGTVSYLIIAALVLTLCVLNYFEERKCLVGFYMDHSLRLMWCRLFQLNIMEDQCKDCLSRYGDSYYKDKTVLWLSYLYNGNSYTAKTAALYWKGPQNLPIVHGQYHGCW